MCRYHLIILLSLLFVACGESSTINDNSVEEKQEDTELKEGELISNDKRVLELAAILIDKLVENDIDALLDLHPNLKELQNKFGAEKVTQSDLSDRVDYLRENLEAMSVSFIDQEVEIQGSKSTVLYGDGFEAIGFSIHISILGEELTLDGHALEIENQLRLTGVATGLYFKDGHRLWERE